jgi:hypothetical protein
MKLAVDEILTLFYCRTWMIMRRDFLESGEQRVQTIIEAHNEYLLSMTWRVAGR